MCRPPRGFDLRRVLRMAARHVVEALVDRHEALGNMAVGDGEQHRRPPDRESIIVEQRADRVRGDRDRQLLKAHQLEMLRADDAVLSAGPSYLWLVDVVEQGGDLDERHIHRDAGRRDEARRFGRNAGHALRVDDDAAR